MERDWQEAYRACPKFGPRLDAMEEAERTGQPGIWPEYFQKVEGRVYSEGLLCVPCQLTGEVIRAQHSEAGHPSVEGMWQHMRRMLLLAFPDEARKLADWIHRSCEVCQVSDPVRTPFKCPVEFTPVQPYLMNSVAVDLVFMPETSYEGKKYDIMALCVDRESGWVVATPHMNKELTGEKVAKRCTSIGVSLGSHPWSCQTADRTLHLAGGSGCVQLMASEWRMGRRTTTRPTARQKIQLSK